MDLRQMEYLLAVAEEENFTRAAELAGISQSGLSAAIRTLETELETTLFNRTTRRVTLTPAGAALVPYARDMLARAASARDAVIKASNTVTGSLRIGAEQCLGFVDVSDLLERFLHRYPGVETEFVQSGSHHLLSLSRAGKIDVVFVAHCRNSPALPHLELGEEPLVALVNAEHPLSRAHRVHWSDLNGADFVDFASSWAMRSLNDELLTAHSISRNVRCTVSDVHTLLDLVARGLGMAVVPEHVAHKPQARGLARLELPSNDFSWKVSAVYPRWDRSNAAAAHFMDLVGPGLPH